MTAIDRRMFRHTVPVDDLAHVIGLSHSPVRAVAFAMSSWNDAMVEFWAEHTEGAPQTGRTFQVFGTGQPLPDDAEWVGTCPRSANGLVFHLYRLKDGR